MMGEVIKMSLGYKICWEEVWTINIITPISLMSFWTIASLPPRTDSNSNVGNIGNNEGIPSLFSILFIWVIASLMGKFITMMTDLAQSLAGGASASKLSGGVKGIAGEIKKNLGGLVKEYGWKKLGGDDLIKRLDDNLFDSGEIADKRREAKKKQYAEDASYKEQFLEHANQALSNHKIKNAARLAGMSEEDRLKELKAVKDNAINEKAKELGIKDPDEIKRLKSDKGFKTTSDNFFVAAFKLTRQAAKSGGTLRKSIDDQDANLLKFSHEEAREGMKAMKNEEERKSFIKAGKDGTISIDKKTSDKAIDAAKSFASGTKKLFTQNPLRTAKATAKAAGRGLKSIMKATGIHDAEYNRAEKQLAATGAISAMMFGTRWSRTDKEKQDIRNRQRENAAARKLGIKQKSNSVDALDALERENEYQTRIEEIDKSDSSSVVKNAKKAVAIVRRAGANKYTKAGRERRANALSAMKDSAQKNVEGKIAKATAKQNKLDDLETKANNNLTAANNDFESYKQSSGIAQLEQSGKKRSLAARAVSPQARKEHDDYKKAQAAKSSPEYVKRDDARKQAQVAMTRIKQEKGNVQAQLDGLRKIESNITHAREIDRERANAAPQEDAASDRHKDAIYKFDSEIDKVQHRRSSLKSRKTDLAQEKKRLIQNPGLVPGGNASQKIANINSALSNIDSDLEGLDQRETILNEGRDKMTKARDIVNSANTAKKTAAPNSKQSRKADALMKKYDKLQSITDQKEFEESLRDFADSEKEMTPELEQLSDEAFWRAVDVSGVERETRKHSGRPTPTAPRPTRLPSASETTS